MAEIKLIFSDFAKVFLITLNGLFGLLGLAMLGVGGYVMVEVKKYSVSTSAGLSRIISYQQNPVQSYFHHSMKFSMPILGCYRSFIWRNSNFHSLSWVIRILTVIPWSFRGLQREQMYERNICSCSFYSCSLSDFCWYCWFRKGNFPILFP